MNTSFVSLSVLNRNTPREAQAGPRSRLGALGQEIQYRECPEGTPESKAQAPDGYIASPCGLLALLRQGSGRRARGRASCLVLRTAVCSQSIEAGDYIFQYQSRATLKERGKEESEEGIRSKGEKHTILRPPPDPHHPPHSRVSPHRRSTAAERRKEAEARYSAVAG